MFLLLAFKGFFLPSHSAILTFLCGGITTLGVCFMLSKRWARRGQRWLNSSLPCTLSPSALRAHTAAHRAKHGAFWMGVVSLPSERFTRFGNPAWPGGRTANFAAFGSWSGVLPKNAESLRNSDALMRVAVPRRRGPAGLRDLFTFVEVAACTPCAQSFLCVRGRGGITTLGVLCVLLKRWTAACQKGSFAVF